MTKERKFTPPTEFPTEYENGFGNKITLLARGIGEHPLDLIEKPKTHKIVGYVNVFKDGDYQVYSSRAFADQYLDAMPDRIACKRIEFEVVEGEFDE